jgi:hypothetical protein
MSTLEIPCGEIARQIPGSNLYFACWSCVLSIVYVAMRWKRAQAIKFAQAREERKQKELEGIGDEIDGDDDDDDDGEYGEDDI